MTKHKNMTLEAATYALWDVYDSGTPITKQVIACYFPPLITSVHHCSLRGKNCKVEWERATTNEDSPMARTLGKLTLTTLDPRIADSWERVSIAVQNPNHPDFNPNPMGD